MAQSLSASGTEVSYQYTAEFRSLLSADQFSKQQIRFEAEIHAAHLFGLFHSPEKSEKYGIELELNEGFAGTKKPKITRSEGLKKQNDYYLWVRYEANGTMLVQNPVLKGWLKHQNQGTIQLPLLKDMPAIYKNNYNEYTQPKRWIQCTDSYYRSATDFSYFYNPFRCSELSREPLARLTPFNIKPTPLSSAVKNTKVPLKQILADNGNGELVTLYFANGFDKVPAASAPIADIQKDSGWRTFDATSKLLENKYNFVPVKNTKEYHELLKDKATLISLQNPVWMEHDKNRIYFRTFIKKHNNVTYIARVGLFNSTNETGTRAPRSFPKFWKEAWENGDFIYFGGHSGDGQALNINNILSTLDSSDISAIQISQNKTQIVFIDSCSSYDHFQDTYMKLKTQNLHFVSYGLVSLFHLASKTIESMLDLLILKFDTQPTWIEALKHTENKQLEGHVEYSYYKKDQADVLRAFKKAQSHPAFLLNVKTN